ncbi:hypothetical protein LCGC14_1785040, partial [marine sediment metagenome]
VLLPASLPADNLLARRRGQLRIAQ